MPQNRLNSVKPLGTMTTARRMPRRCPGSLRRTVVVGVMTSPICASNLLSECCGSVSLRLQFGDHARARERRVTHLHAELRRHRQKNVDARAEADQAHSIALLHLIAFLGVGDDAPRDEP